MSLIENTLEEIKALKWHGFHSALELQFSQSAYSKMSFEERLAHLISSEISERKTRKVRQLLSRSKLKYKQAALHEIDYRASRNLEKSMILSLSRNEWIDRCHNIIITGATGTGKSWLACAIAHQAISDGFSVYYCRLNKLFAEIKLLRADGSYLAWLKKMARYRVLILDDFGSTAMKPADVGELLEIIEERSGSGSNIITSQLPVAQWHSYLDQPLIADAVLDRLIHNSYRINLKGESMRQIKSDLPKNEEE